MVDSARAVAPLVPHSAVDEGAFGVYPAPDFHIADGAHAGARTIASARWYFGNETIAVPNANVRVAGFVRGAPACGTTGQSRES